MFLVQNDHRIINGDHAHQAPAFINDGGRNQMVLVERIGDLALVLPHRNDAKTVFDQLGHQNFARAAHQPTKRHIAGWFHAWINQNDVVKLFGQIVLIAQEINGLPNIPMFGRDHQFALHQTAGGSFGVRQRLLDHHPVVFIQRAKHGLSLRLIKVFDQVNNVICFQIAHRLGQKLWRHRVHHIFAQTLGQFGQDIAIQRPAI